MKNLLIILTISFGIHLTYAQEERPTVVDTIVIRIQQQKAQAINDFKIKDTLVLLNSAQTLNQKLRNFTMPSFWKKKNKFGLNFSEVAFVNWNAGGNNSISAIASVYFERNYKFRYFTWDNALDLRYGLNAQEGREVRKSDDQIKLSSTFGYRSDTISKWYYSGKLKFNTQFANGYNYPDTSDPKSGFMAPGYLFLGIGTSYKDEDKKITIYLSPITQKATFVMDQNLANQGAFGVQAATYDAEGQLITEGKRIYMELGSLMTGNYETSVGENVLMKTDLALYMDYLNSFGNVDVDWSLDFHFKVNDFISSSIGTHILYDDDIKFDQIKTEDGIITDPGSPKIQFKQVLGIGIVYAF